MKKFLVLAVGATFFPALGFAQSSTAITGPAQGDRELMLAANGSSDADFDNNRLNISASFAHFFTDAVSLGLRQDIHWIDLDNQDSVLRGATDVFGHWHFGDVGATVRPFLGLNIGYFYGDQLTDTWVAGPELGAKWYVQPRTFVLTQIDYQVTFTDADEFDENWDDGRFRYQVGVGYNF